MKIVSVDREIESTISGEKIAFTIDPGAVDHIMGHLTALYNDSESACVREISTNAWDAHVESGDTDKPIEITLPSPMASFFRVKDHGVGLSADDIRNIYTRYGASTKRHTNLQTGSLGFGCKAPLAYTDQFTLVSTKNNATITAAVSREKVGVSLTILDHTEHDHDVPSGTEVIIPAKKFNSFDKKCRDFFRFWPVGSVLVNGEQPMHFSKMENTQKITDSLYIISGVTDYVVMAHVAYPAAGPTKINHGMAQGRSLVAFVGPTEVDHAPAREGLKDDPNTLATIQRIKSDFDREMKGFVQRIIDEQPTPILGMRKMLVWRDALPASAQAETYKYKNAEIPTRWAPESGDLRLVDVKSSKFNSSSKREYITSASFGTTIWVYGYDRTEFTVGQKKKLLHWLDSDATEHTEWTMQRFALIPDDKPVSDFIPSNQCVSWEIIKAIKLPRTVPVSKGGTGRIPGSYDFYENGVYRHGVPGSEIDTTNPVFWVHKYEDSTFNALLGAFYDDYTVVVLTSNRVEKFKRLFPQARPAIEGVRDYYNQWVKTITEEDLKALAVQEHEDDKNYKVLDENKVNDPDLKRAIQLSKRDMKSMLRKRRAFTQHLHVELPSTHKHESALDKYSLLRKTYSYWTSIDRTMQTHEDDVYLFINAKYAAKGH